MTAEIEQGKVFATRRERFVAIEPLMIHTHDPFVGAVEFAEPVPALLGWRLCRPDHSSTSPVQSMRVHSQGWLKDVSRIQATREIERGQDHEQEKPITQNIFHYAHRSSAPRLPLLNPARFFGPRALTAWENTLYSLSFRRSVTAGPERIDST